MKHYVLGCLDQMSAKLWLCAVCLMMVACSTTTGPVIIRDVDTRLPPRATEIDNTHQGNTANVEVGRAPEKIIVQPVAPSISTPSSPLKAKLIQLSEKNLFDKNYQAAITVAERGLRIDRKEPRFYQVLAAAYDGLGNRQQSIQFAKQGLRYTSKSSALYPSLLRWTR